MPAVIHDFAILAPVPEEHLLTGRKVAEQTGFVAFGTRKWDLLQKVDSLRGDDPVPVLIYTSHEEGETSNSFAVFWFGWYVGNVASKGGAHPDGMIHRPPSTDKYPADNSGYWPAFWHVRDLRELPALKRIQIGKIGTVKGGWRKDAPPRGPELVALPESLSYET